MFGRAKREKEREAREERLRKEKLESEEIWRELWKKTFEDAKGNDHVMTRAVIRYDIENRTKYLEEWLQDFDRRVAAEMREHAQKTQRWLAWIAVMITLILLQLSGYLR